MEEGDRDGQHGQRLGENYTHAVQCKEVLDS